MPKLNEWGQAYRPPSTATPPFPTIGRQSSVARPYLAAADIRALGPQIGLGLPATVPGGGVWRATAAPLGTPTVPSLPGTAPGAQGIHVARPEWTDESGRTHPIVPLAVDTGRLARLREWAYPDASRVTGTPAWKMRQELLREWANRWAGYDIAAQPGTAAYQLQQKGTTKAELPKAPPKAPALPQYSDWGTTRRSYGGGGGAAGFGGYAQTGLINWRIGF